MLRQEHKNGKGWNRSYLAEDRVLGPGVMVPTILFQSFVVAGFAGWVRWLSLAVRSTSGIGVGWFGTVATTGFKAASV